MTCQHLGIVHSIVAGMQLPPGIDYEDAAQSSTIGMLQAQGTYDPGRGAWSTHAASRIRGAVVDLLRSWSWRPRGRVDGPCHVPLGPWHDRGVEAWPGERMADEDDRRAVREAVRGLPADERTVIEGMLSGQALRDIDRAAGRSATGGRARQLRDQAFGRLRLRLKRLKT